MSETSWTVSEVARMARVTVRTLHHYDEIGLLTPGRRSGSGYRLYGRRELERLQEILLYRELGLTLEKVAELLDGRGEKARVAALREHRQRLLDRRTRLDALLHTVDRTLEEAQGGTTMKDEEMFEGFAELTDAPDEVKRQHREHANEVHERWGEDESYASASRRTRDYSEEQWIRIRREGDAAEARMAGLLAAGADAQGPEARDGAEAMRLHIDRWFYACSHQMHVGLAEMYEADARFRAHYEERATGLAEFVVAAIRANASRRAAG